MTPERRESLARGEGDYGDAEVYRETVRQLGKDGWLGIGWPKEYGGQARGDDRAAHLHGRGASAQRARPVAHAQLRRPDDHAVRHRGAEAAVPRADPARASCTSRSATPSRRPGPTSRRCARARSAWGTSTSSTARRCGRASPSTPTTSGSPSAPIRTRRSTRACRCSSSRRTPKGSATRRSTRWPARARTRRSTRTSACRSATASGDENDGWRLITNQLNHERVALTSSARLVEMICARCASGRRTRSSPTASA